MKKGILFDLDGTLWNSTHRLVESYNRVLDRHPDFCFHVTMERMESGMGKNPKDLSDHLFPQVPEELRLPLIEECFAEENLYLLDHYGLPYPDLKETLEQLSKKYTLAIVSNCQAGYIEIFMDTMGLTAYITDHECAATGLSKGENIKLVMERSGIEKAIYVGDTQGDLNSADQAGIPFVYAAYGFGTVDRETRKVDSLAQLPALAEEIL